jgi:hypothetical protein
LQNNSAVMGSSALDASGGGLSVARGGRASLFGTTLIGNYAGGIGTFEALLTAGSSTAERYWSRRAAHILSAGMAELQLCSLSDPRRTIGSSSAVSQAEVRATDRGSGSWIVGKDSGRIIILNSSLRSDALEHTSLWVVDTAEALIRGCTAVNVTIGASSEAADRVTSGGVNVRPIGVVDSVFTPALDRSVPIVQPVDGTCAVMLVGEQLCDARALCEQVLSGGVKCSCAGTGLRYKPNVTEDGQQCEQDASLRAVLESESLAISVRKPSNITSHTHLNIESHGEAEIAVAFDITMTRFEASTGISIAANDSIAIDQPSVSAFGQHIEWKRTPPNTTWLADLDGSKFKYLQTQRHEFGVRLNCESDEQSCAADGDRIETIVRLASPQDSRLRSEVKVQTLVVALASCLHSVAVVMQAGGSSKSSSPVTGLLLTDVALVFVELRVADTDGMPIRVSEPKAVVLWSSGESPPFQIVPTKPADGGSHSNLFTAGVEASLRSSPGSYRLQVVLVDAWDEELGAVGDCVLHEQIIRIEKPIADELACDAGQYMLDRARCEDCPKGTSGAGGKMTTCTLCAPGAAIRLRPVRLSMR